MTRVAAGTRGSSAPRRSPYTRDTADNARAIRRTVEATPTPPQQSRAFGASALHDEAVLDIPAYLRRGQSARESS